MSAGHRIVGPQFAAYVAEHGGGSMNFVNGRLAHGPGFMVARPGTEERVSTPPTGEEIQDYADRHYPSVAGDRNAHLGVWGNVLDVSTKKPVGRDARVAGREGLQEAAYALGSESSPEGTPTRISSTENTDTLNRPRGADVLLSLGPTPKAEREASRVVGVAGPRKSMVVPKRPDEETPVYRDLADPSVQADPAWARSPNANDFNLNEVDNDSWSTTDRKNSRKSDSVYRGVNKQHGAGSPRRTTLGDVLRTINEGRVREARGEGLVVNETKGWHPKTAGPSRVRSQQFDRAPVVYNEDLESERPAPREQETDEQFRARNWEAGLAEAKEYLERSRQDVKASPEKRRIIRNGPLSLSRLVPEQRPPAPRGD